ncbi:MAG: response regulator [Candidatus Omnitrophota bacterium]
MQILIVEDEKKLAHALRRGLLEENYAVNLAFDGEVALEKSDVNEYDLIILDLMIPKVDGIAVLKKSVSPTRAFLS